MIDYYSASTVSKTDITYSAFMKHVQQDEVKQVTIVDNVISGKLKMVKISQLWLPVMTA